MSKKIVAWILVVCLCTVSLAACKKAKKNEATSTTSAAEQNGVKTGEYSDAANNENADNGSGSETSQAGDAGENGSGSSSSGESWQKQDDGSFHNGDVVADAVKYGKTDLEEGCELIEQLAKSGLKESKKISSETTSTTAVYVYSGTRISSDTTEFIKFEFIVQDGVGYLVTVLAPSEADLDCDISFITDNLAKVAK